MRLYSHEDCGACHVQPAPKRRALPPVLATLPLLLGILCASGCSRGEHEAATAKAGVTSDTPEGGEDSASQADSALRRGRSAEANRKLSPREILSQMVQAYQAAESYADAGQMFFSAVLDGESYTDPPRPFEVSLERPNKLRMQVMGAHIVSNGDKLTAQVEYIPGQAMQVEAPQLITEVNYAPDDSLRFALNSGWEEIYSPQMMLLVSKAPWEKILAGGASPERLEDAQVAGRDCFRVAVEKPSGQALYWIDQKTFVLRRFDFPAGELKEKVDPEGRFDNLTAWIEFQDAALNPRIDPAAFEVQLPAEVVRLRYFVTPVAGPHQAVGKMISDFEFTNLEGEKVNRQTLGKKIVLLEFWFTTCPLCRENMPVIERLYKKYEGRDEVAFLAVSTDPPVVDDEALRSTLNAWGSSLPIVRDTQQQAQSRFGIPGAPTTVILGPDDRVHLYKPEYDPEHADTEEVLAELLEGKDPAGDILAHFDEVQAQFEKEIAQASVDADPQQVEVPAAKVAPRSEPQSFKLVPLWEAKAVESPGNLLVLEQEDGAPRILVFDGWRTVVELSADGKETARYDLELPEEAVVSFLRTALDGDGNRYYVTWSSYQQQLFLLDDQFSLKLAYPDQKHNGIADVALADLDGDGALEIVVGYFDTVGVQAVSLEGELQWSNRSIDNVVQVIVGDADADGHRKTYAYGTRGTIVPIDHAGSPGSDIRVENRVLTQLLAADVNSDGTKEIAAIAVDPRSPGKNVVIGIDLEGEELWSYPLPEGVHRHVVEPIVAARLSAEDGGWLIPAADGSVHLLTPAGEPVEHFNHGTSLTGAAMTQLDGQPVLLLSTMDDLQAWKIEPREP